MKKFIELFLAVFFYFLSGVIMVLKHYYANINPDEYNWMYLPAICSFLLAFGLVIRWVYLRFKLNNWK